MRSTSVILDLFFVLLIYTSSQNCIAAQNPAVINVYLAQQSKPFVQVVNSFKKTLLDNQSNIEILMADEVNSAVAVGVDINFVLGDKAINQVLQQKGVKLLATLFDDQNLLLNQENTTGLYLDKTPLAQLNWHKKILPKAKRVGILFDPKLNQSRVEQFKAAAAGLDLEIIAIAVNHPRQLPAALKELGRQADSILSIPDKLVYSRKTAKAVLLFSYHNRIPLIGLSRAWVKAGALYALEWDYSSIGEKCAVMALNIINHPAAAIPMVRPVSKESFSVNAKTAQQLKLKLDDSLLSNASTVYR